MRPAVPPRAVPARALLLSLAALAAPVTSQVLFPGLVGGEYGFLVWITALLPAFLLAYYRGLRGVTVAAAAGMAVLSLTQAGASIMGADAPDSKVMLVAVGVYLVICGNVAVMAELLHRERQRAEELALMDPLTRLPNRRYVEQTLDMQVAAAARGRQLALIMFDIDHFKRVNDTHGHDMGDAAIRGFAEVLRKHTRRMDFSGRYGGEEFISVLSDCPGEPALRFADRVRNDLRSRTFPFGRITVSAGVASYQKGMGSHEVLVAEADRALYQAKREGRDRSVLATPERPAQPAAPPPVPVSGNGRILVVDDDKDVLAVVVKVLRANGYTVDGSTSPRDVIRRYQTEGHVADLLVTDVLMPDITGVVMVDLILQSRPDLRVVYMSGYVQRGGVTWAGLPGAVVGFVPKPIEMTELVQAVKDTLAREAPALPAA